MNGTPPTIVFDLDGTLVDTADDLITSLNHALSTEGLEPVEPSWLRPYVGHGGRSMIERVYAAERRALAPDLLNLLVQAFLDHYSANIPGVSRPFAGVVDALERLSDAGFPLAVCTNKPQVLSDRLVGAVGLDRHFAAICGADAFTFRKPDPRHLTETILRAGGDPACAVMVGDSRTDIDTARAAGIPVVAVDFGYSDVHVRDLGPSAVISSYDELTPSFVGRLIEAASG